MMRLWAFFAATGAFIGAYLIGAATEVTTAEADALTDQFESLIEGIDAFGIFSHNAMIAMPMFVPVLGPALGAFSAWSTGYAFAALTLGVPDAADLPAISIFLTPFGIMELAAYSLGMSRGALFGIALLRSRPARPHLRMMAIEGGIVAALLAAGAVVEHAAISTLEASPDVASV